MTCFHIPGFTRRIEETGGIVRIVASEGEAIRVRGSDIKDENIPGQGMVRIVTDVIHDEKVPHFPRPGTEKNLPEQGLIAEVTQQVMAERRAGAPAKLLGISEDDDEHGESAQGNG